MKFVVFLCLTSVVAFAAEKTKKLDLDVTQKAKSQGFDKTLDRALKTELPSKTSPKQPICEIGGVYYRGYDAERCQERGGKMQYWGVIKGDDKEE